jgi:hypothetical protein
LYIYGQAICVMSSLHHIRVTRLVNGKHGICIFIIITHIAWSCAYTEYHTLSTLSFQPPIIWCPLPQVQSKRISKWPCRDDMINIKMEQKPTHLTLMDKCICVISAVVTAGRQWIMFGEQGPCHGGDNGDQGCLAAQTNGQGWATTRSREVNCADWHHSVEKHLEHGTKGHQITLSDLSSLDRQIRYGRGLNMEPALRASVISTPYLVLPNLPTF